jgi:hypothetical protein
MLGSVPFWCNLNEEESDFYIHFLTKSRLWAAWCATKPEKRVGLAPDCPTDEEFIRSSQLWWVMFS